MDSVAGISNAVAWEEEEGSISSCWNGRRVEVVKGEELKEGINIIPKPPKLPAPERKRRPDQK